METAAPPSGDLADRRGRVRVLRSVDDGFRAQGSCPIQRHGAESTAITRAPSAAPIITADSPTPPHPCTASQSPAPIRPCAVSARKAVANRQPRDAAVTKSTESGRRTRFTSAAWIATRSANDPGPVKPGWVWCGQTWVSPGRQYSHVPQPQTNGTVTRSPTR